MNPEVQTPAIILDAHVNSFDILFTARYLRKQYPEVPILMPIAGYLLHVPGVSKWVKYWSNKYALTITPVYRKEEFSPNKSIPLAFFTSFYPKILTERERKERNNQFQLLATRFLEDMRGIVLVSPYGGPVHYGGEVRRGVRELLNKAQQVYLSYSSIFTGKTKLEKYHIQEAGEESELILSFRKLIAS